MHPWLQVLRSVTKPLPSLKSMPRYRSLPSDLHFFFYHRIPLSQYSCCQLSPKVSLNGLLESLDIGIQTFSMWILTRPCLVPQELVIQQLVQWILNPFDWCDVLEVREGIIITVYFPSAQVLRQSCDSGSLSAQQIWVLPEVAGSIKYM